MSSIITYHNVLHNIWQSTPPCSDYTRNLHSSLIRKSTNAGTATTPDQNVELIVLISKKMSNKWNKNDKTKKNDWTQQTSNPTANKLLQKEIIHATKSGFKKFTNHNQYH